MSERVAAVVAAVFFWALVVFCGEAVARRALGRWWQRQRPNLVAVGERWGRRSTDWLRVRFGIRRRP